ncbi:MAG: SPOR domain-containing protein [Candidatus Marinimicrobia bacterium]|nr:SPOR domain-containing protein [Candidatus Neomarinimicrobiota bacterium]
MLITACGKEGLTGKTGEAISLNADIAEDSDDLDYIWTIVEQPDASMLRLANFNYNDQHSTVSFIPDAPGEYTLEVKVVQYGDELAVQLFTIAVEQGDAVPIKTVEQVEPDWYEDENDRQWFEEEIATEDTITEAPEITEVAPAIEKDEELSEEVELETPPPAPLKPKPIQRDLHIPKNEGRFTIQVVSKKLLADAEVIASKLIDDGFDAYIQKAYFKETDEVWFRVRVGSYDSRPTALTVSKSISKSRGTSTWVDYVRYEE